MSTERAPVIILCGGKGTRMGGQMMPKPLVEIGDRPVLWHVMKIFAAQGFNDFILALGYGGDEIKRYFLEYDWRSRDFALEFGDGGKRFLTPNDIVGWRITFAETGLETMTGARVRKAARYVEHDRFFVTYADGVADIDLHALLRYHRQRDLLATITGVKAFTRFGLMETDGQGRVTGFQEKPATRWPTWMVMMVLRWSRSRCVSWPTPANWVFTTTRGSGVRWTRSRKRKS